MADEVTRRVLQLIDYLGAYDAQRNPPVRDLAKAGPFALAEDDLPEAEGVRLTPADEVWLTVDFVGLPPRPTVPPDLEPLLGPGDDLDPDRSPLPPVPSSPAGSTGSGADRSEPAGAGRAGDDTAGGDRGRAEDWVAGHWEPWAERYRTQRRVKELYRDLFEQREMLAGDRETYELVWGFGRVRHRRRPGGNLDHPLVTVPVEIDADLTSGQLRVHPTGPPAVETLFLAGLDLADRVGFSALTREVAESDEPVELWAAKTRRDLLRRLLRTIDHDGGIVEESAVEPGRYTLSDTWVLLLRRRRPDYQGFLDELRRNYRNGAVPPDPLKAIVVDAPSSLIPEAGADRNQAGSAPGDGEVGEVDEVGGAAGSDRTPLLLPLPFNDEQQRIVELAAVRPGVTVQGPPGTGKSHTIANIISHYVANGKRVLVVAEKEQALRVLAERVPAGIRDLTVSVLGADDEGRRQLESSITQIQSRVSGFDREHADLQIGRFERRLAELDAEGADLDRRLLMVRRSEVESLPGAWSAGEDPTPATVAAWLASTEKELGCIDDRVALDRPAPLDDAGYADLLDLLDRIGLDQATACLAHRPDPERLPAVGELATYFDAEAEIEARVRALGESDPARDLSWETVEGLPAAQAAEVGDALATELAWRTKVAGGWVDRLLTEVGDPLLREQWQTFVDECDRLRHHLIGRLQLIEAHDVIVPDDPPPDLVDELRAISTRLFTKGRLGFARAASRRRATLARCTVDGRPPATPDEIDLCVARLEAEADRRTLVTRWRNRMDLIDGPGIDTARPEATVAIDLEHLERSLDTERRWRDLRAQVERFGLSAPIEVGPDELVRLTEVFEVLVFRQNRRQVIENRRALVDYLAVGGTEPAASPLWSDLALALAREDLEAWEQARARAVELRTIESDADRLLVLHRAVRRSAPMWAERLVADPAARVAADRFGQAWEWRRLETWLVTLHEQGEPSALQRRIEQVADERRLVVEELVSVRAWRRLADQIGDRERQALNSYLQAVKRYGRTGGKFAARWMAQIRAALNESRDAVPVWIMPTNRALASFTADPEPRFDVLVIDEASQLGHEALPLLALARTTIVVGDDKQTSPEHVGLQREPVFGLLEQFLTDIPAYKTLFDPDASLYDLAFQKFPDVIMLTEHFRSLPEIIRFSNRHAYDDLIVPLRDRPPSPGWRQLGAVKVDGVRTGDSNHVEADAVVDLIVRACDDPAYDGMTFGVISMLGTSQSGVIWRRLFDALGPEVIRSRRIRCGEPAGFQGDERDVMVISTVVAPEADGGELRIGAMTTRAAERRVNVAASRARNQMWVVHSVEPDRFPPGDLRAELISHARSGHRPPVDPDPTDLAERCRTPFQRTVLQALVDRGYRRIQVDHPVGRCSIDLVVESEDSRLAVVCDDDVWPGEEMWRIGHHRQRVLERAGWSFERIRASAFHRHPESALEPVWERLDRLGIAPSGRTSSKRPAQARTRVRDAVASASASASATATASAAVEETPATAPRRRGRRRVPDGPAGGPHPTMVGHRDWVAWKVAAPDSDHDEVLDGLLDIVEVEGPITVDRLCQLYLAATGAKRAAAAARVALEAAVDRAVTAGDLSAVADGAEGEDRTVHLPGGPPVIVRRLGSRTVTEVPRSELHRLLTDVDPGLVERRDDARQAVRTVLGLTRLAGKAATWIDESLDRRWEVD
jgi:hypothetical protein